MTTNKMTKQDVENMLKEISGGIFADFRKEMEENQRKFADNIFKNEPQVKKPEYHKGQNAIRFIRALAAGKGDPDRASKFAKEKFKDEVVSKSLTEQDFAAGGALVPDEFVADLIELLRARAVVRASGAFTIPMNSGSLTLPKQTGSGTASYVGEVTNITSSEQTFGQLQLSAKKLAALTPVSNDLIRDSSPSADTIVREDLLAIMALREDLAFIRDDGTENKPKGIRFFTDSSNVFASSGNTLANVTDDLTRAIRQVEESNIPMTRMGWLFTPRTKWFLMGLRDADGQLVFKPEMDRGTLFGIPFRTTTQIPNNLGVGTDESEIYVGDFAQAMIGENTQLQVQVFEGGAFHDGTNVVSGISTDQTIVRTIARHDFVLRHDESFSIITGFTGGA